MRKIKFLDIQVIVVSLAAALLLVVVVRGLLDAYL